MCVTSPNPAQHFSHLLLHALMNVLWLEELVAKNPHGCSRDQLPASLTISANDLSTVCAAEK